MRVVGIIAEYNPLHNGHIYHLEQAKALTGADFCVVVMSGNFVQRGEPAAADKFTRAEWAVRAGADLVLELPSVYAVSSAERFALGGVRTLYATGVMTDLSFGCETDDLLQLQRLKDLLSSETQTFQQALRQELRLGKSYPRARRDALAVCGADAVLLDTLERPNNILAIEYLRALALFAPEICPVPVARAGNAYHDTALSGTLSSATSIRAALVSGDEAVREALPLFVGARMLYDERYPVTEILFSKMILSTLRNMSPDAVSALPDVKEGLENVIIQAMKRAVTLEDFYTAIKSKRYTLARCKRIAISALLGLTRDQVYRTISDEKSEYLHVLAFSSKSRRLLSEIGKRCSAPLLLRQADCAECTPLVRENLAIDARSTDLYAIATETDLRRDHRGPVIV